MDSLLGTTPEASDLGPKEQVSLDAIRNPAHLTELRRRISLFHCFIGSQGLGIDARRLRFMRSPR